MTAAFSLPTLGATGSTSCGWMTKAGPRRPGPETLRATSAGCPIWSLARAEASPEAAAQRDGTWAGAKVLCCVWVLWRSGWRTAVCLFVGWLVGWLLACLLPCLFISTAWQDAKGDESYYKFFLVLPRFARVAWLDGLPGWMVPSWQAAFLFATWLVTGESTAKSSAHNCHSFLPTARFSIRKPGTHVGALVRSRSVFFVEVRK